MPVREPSAQVARGNAADETAAWVNGHPDDGVLHAGLDDQLSASESAAVADHVATCAACRTRVAEAHGLIAGARRIVKRVKEVNDGNAETSTDMLQHGTPSAVGRDESEPVAIAAGTNGGRVEPEPTAATRTGLTGKSVAVSAEPKQPVAARVADAVSMASSLKAPRIPWNRFGLAASVLVLIASARMVWKTVSTADAEQTPAVTLRVEQPPADVQPSRTVPETASVVASDASPAAPRQAPLPVNSGTPQAGNPNGAVDAVPVAGVAAFDSLVLTRRTCRSQCDDFVLSVSSSGSMHFALHSGNGKERFDNGTLASPALRRMSALITSVLFETSAVPASGRSVCTVFDDAHVAALQLMVAHGSSRALHANSCLASNKALLKLGAQLDSLAGSDGARKSLQNQK